MGCSVSTPLDESPGSARRKAASRAQQEQGQQSPPPSQAKQQQRQQQQQQKQQQQPQNTASPTASPLHKKTNEEKEVAANNSSAKAKGSEYFQRKNPKGGKVVVVQGRNVRSRDIHGGLNVIFLFGGPGALKGQIIEVMREEFDFHAISLEEIALDRARTLMSKPGVRPTIPEALTYLCNHPDAVTMEMVLPEVLDRMRMHPARRNFVVDVIPNHDSISTSTHLLRDGGKYLASSDYADFQARFALVLDIAKPEHMTASDATSSTLTTTATTTENLTSSPSTSLTINPAAPPGTGGLRGDEADDTRRRRRSVAYSRASGPLISFFERTERCVKLTRTFPNQRVTTEIRDLLQGLDFPRSSQHVCVVLRRSSDEHAGLAEKFASATSLSQSTAIPIEELWNVAKAAVRRSSLVLLTAPWVLDRPCKLAKGDDGLLCEVQSHVFVDDTKLELEAHRLRAFLCGTVTVIVDQKETMLSM